LKIIINKTTKLILGLGNQALIFSTSNLPGFDQMALDLNSLDQTISNPEIIFTLRFYYWTGDWLSIGYHQKEIPPHWEQLLFNQEINTKKILKINGFYINRIVKDFSGINRCIVSTKL